MFDFLTLSVVIDNRIFCVHGGMEKSSHNSPFFDSLLSLFPGLSPSIHSIDQIKVVDRFRGQHFFCKVFQPIGLTWPPEIPHEGPMADLVWSDPDPEKEDFAISPR